MKEQVRNHQEKSCNLRLKSLDYSKNKNSFWRFEILKNFNLYFNLDRFKANLKQIDRLAKTDQRYPPFLKFYSHYWNIYKTSINNFNDFYSDSATLLSKTIPFDGSEECLSFKKVRELVRKHLAGSAKPWVIIGDDHRISHATIKELVSQNKTRTAVIVIDNHADIYGPGPAKNNPLKFNPFRNLIESGTVKHIFFLCPSFKELLRNKSTWRDIAKSISFIPFASSKRGMKFNQKKFETALARTLKQKSIKNIFLSIDIDALVGNRQNIIYSAFEYSILNSILYLSLLSGEQVRKYECLSTCSVDLTKVFYPVPQKAPYVSAGMNVLKPEGHYPKAMDARPSQPKRPLRRSRLSPWYGVYKKIKFPSIVRIRNPYKPGLNTVNESGITPLMYCDIIQKVTKISKKMGLVVGLGSCIGEVVELMGPDWKGETTKATIQIVNSFK